MITMRLRARLNEIRLAFGFYGSTLTLPLLHPDPEVLSKYFCQYVIFISVVFGILKFVLFGISSFILDWPILLNSKVINCIMNNEPNTVEICITA